MMNIDWSADLIASVCNGRILKSGSVPITGFSTDSRTIRSGNVYFALSGENFNGHRFVGSAIGNGAAGVVVSEELPDEFDFEGFVVTVEDCLKALQDCAAYYRSQHKGCFVAVTGSNGKTTTRSMLSHLLSEKHFCASTSGNLNNHIGLPLTILSVPAAAEFVVLEMGMNHSGEIRDLCRIAKPDAALINNIGPAHIGMLGSLENIARAKAEIFENMGPKAIKVAPADTDFCSIFSESSGNSLVTFGLSQDANYRLSDICMTLNQVSFKFLIENQNCASVTLSMSGRHNAFNAAAALSVYHQLGFDVREGAQRLLSFSAVSARMEKIERNGINILLDCYNANPGSMIEALHFLKVCPAPRIAVLGDMKELGSMSAQLHSQIGELAAQLSPEFLICVGEEAEEIAKAALKKGMSENRVYSLNSHDKAADLLSEQLKTGATVLFKASRGMHFEKIVRKIWPELAEDLH